MKSELELDLELMRSELAKLPKNTCTFCWERSTIGAKRDDVCDACLPQYMSAEKRHLEELSEVNGKQ